MAEHGREHPIGITWIDGDLWNLLSIAQAELGPALARVGRLVDTVADRQVGAMQPFTGTHVNDIRIRRCDRDRADRAGRLIVEDRHPGAASIGCLPHTAVVHADVEDVRLVGYAGRRFGATAAERTDGPPAHLGEECGVDRRRRLDDRLDRSGVRGRRSRERRRGSNGEQRGRGCGDDQGT